MKRSDIDLVCSEEMPTVEEFRNNVKRTRVWFKGNMVEFEPEQERNEDTEDTEEHDKSPLSELAKEEDDSEIFQEFQMGRIPCILMEELDHAPKGFIWRGDSAMEATISKFLRSQEKFHYGFNVTEQICMILPQVLPLSDFAAKGGDSEYRAKFIEHHNMLIKENFAMSRLEFRMRVCAFTAYSMECTENRDVLAQVRGLLGLVPKFEETDALIRTAVVAGFKRKGQKEIMRFRNRILRTEQLEIMSLLCGFGASTPLHFFETYVWYWIGDFSDMMRRNMQVHGWCIIERFLASCLHLYETGTESARPKTIAMAVMMHLLGDKLVISHACCARLCRDSFENLSLVRRNVAISAQGVDEERLFKLQEMWVSRDVIAKAQAKAKQEKMMEDRKKELEQHLQGEDAGMPDAEKTPEKKSKRGNLAPGYVEFAKRLEVMEPGKHKTRLERRRRKEVEKRLKLYKQRKQDLSAPQETLRGTLATVVSDIVSGLKEMFVKASIVQSESPEY